MSFAETPASYLACEEDGVREWLSDLALKDETYSLEISSKSGHMIAQLWVIVTTRQTLHQALL